MPRAESRLMSAEEHLASWLANQGVPPDRAHEAVEAIKDFYADAFGILGYPPAIEITGSQKAGTLHLRLLWPTAVSPDDRGGLGQSLRESLRRDLARLLAPSVLCRLAFAEHPSARRKDFLCHLGPPTSEYQRLTREYLADARAVGRSPQVAQHIKSLVESFSERSREERSAIAEQVRGLAARLRSA